MTSKDVLVIVDMQPFFLSSMDPGIIYNCVEMIEWVSIKNIVLFDWNMLVQISVGPLFIPENVFLIASTVSRISKFDSQCQKIDCLL